MGPAGVLEVGHGRFEVPGLPIVWRVGGDPVEGVVQEVERRADAHVGVAELTRVLQRRHVDQGVPVVARPGLVDRDAFSVPVTRTMSACQVLDSLKG